jgi:oligopeptide/dipeptide ABC transporter ATP-binding protein
MMDTPLLQVKDLEVKYQTREGILTAIRNTSFTVHRGEIVGIVGESGCGKSTIASAVMRLLPPNGRISAGQILLEGQDIVGYSYEEMRQLRGQEMAMIFQDAMTSLNPVFPIDQQMIDAQRAHISALSQRSDKELRQRAVQMLDRVGIPDAAQRIREYPHQFSGGMRQRIMIAMALLSKPRLVVADEPTSALDVTLEAQILELICSLRDEMGTALLYITHDLGVVARVCDRVIVMYAGNIAEAGDVFSIFDQPKHPYTQALLRSHPSHSQREHRLRTIPGRVPSLRDLPLGCKFAPRCELARTLCHEVEPDDWRVGRQTVLCHAYAPGWEGPTTITAVQPQVLAIDAKEAEAQERTIIQAEDLTKHFRDEVGLLGPILGQKAGAVQAVSEVNLSIKRGQTLGLVGESGSGKTTLGRTILRLIEPTRGRIAVLGHDISDLSQSRLRPMRARMQMIFQDPTCSLSPRMKVSSLLLEPFRIHGQPVDEKAKVEELLAMVGLSSEQADKCPNQLSGGQARRVGIARALALHPDILLADEPTAGLDVSVAAGILNLLKDLRERLDLTYVIITHNLNVLGFIADQVAVMYLGRIVELAATEEIFSRPKHPYSEALMSAISIPGPHLRHERRPIVLQGEIPSPRNPPPGCAFHPRCRYAEVQCTLERPLLRTLPGTERLTACHFPERVERGMP